MKPLTLTAEKYRITCTIMWNKIPQQAFFGRLSLSQNSHSTCCPKEAILRCAALTKNANKDKELAVARKDYGPRAERAVKELIQLLPNACLWVAGIWDQDIPAELQKETLTTPLRSAPVVLREVEPAVAFYTNVDNYSDSAVPFPGDGLSSIRLSHHGTAHTGRWPVDCDQCGQDVADMLQNRLRVGGKDGSIKMSDVFILTRSIELQDEVKDQAGNLTSSASGFVRGLRAAGLLVDVLGVSLGTKDLATWKTETANMRSSSSNKITVAHWTNVQGTERKVVVWLKGLAPNDESQEVAEANDRLQLVSRCTTQLIVVDLPPDSCVSQ